MSAFVHQDLVLKHRWAACSWGWATAPAWGECSSMGRRTGLVWQWHVLCLHAQPTCVCEPSLLQGGAGSHPVAHWVARAGHPMPNLSQPHISCPPCHGFLPGAGASRQRGPSGGGNTSSGTSRSGRRGGLQGLHDGASCGRVWQSPCRLGICTLLSTLLLTRLIGTHDPFMPRVMLPCSFEASYVARVSRRRCATHPHARPPLSGACAQEPLTLIYEVFSTALEEFLGPQRQH